MLDSVSAELLLNSILVSFEKLVEFFESLQESNTKWKNEILIEKINELIDLNHSIFSNISSTKISQDKLSFFEEQNKKIIVQLKSFL